MIILWLILLKMFQLWCIFTCLLILLGLIVGIVNIYKASKSEKYPSELSLGTIVSYGKGICYWCFTFVFVGHFIMLATIRSSISTTYRIIGSTINEKIQTD
jgi:hypothetical protein